MLGDNAIYLAKHIATWNISNMDKNKQVSILTDNKVIVDAFQYALDDMHTILFHFFGNHNRLNLYGFKMKFESIQFIAHNLCSIIDNGMVWCDVISTDFNKVAKDLETITNILDYEINNNIQFVDSRDKNYNTMPLETLA